MRYLWLVILGLSCHAEDMLGMRIKQEHKCFVRKDASEAYHEEVVTARGTAFCADLEAYGLKSKRYLLTAAHNVIAGDNKVDNPKVEFDDKWHKTDVLYMDEEIDLAILETDADVPVRAKIADVPANAKDKVTMYASYGGEPIVKAEGQTSLRFWTNRVFTLVVIPFAHGNSGSPLVKDGKVVGIADAGIPEDLEGKVINPNKGLFIPVEVIKYFLEEYVGLKKEKRK